MVEVQVGAVKQSATILAGVMIPLENVVTGKLDLFLGQTIKVEQDDDPRHADVQRDAVQHDRFGRPDRQITPAGEIVREIILVGVRVYDLRMSFVEQIESASGTTNVDGLPQPVKDENGTFQDALHAGRYRRGWPELPGKLKLLDSAVNRRQVVL